MGIFIRWSWPKLRHQNTTSSYITFLNFLLERFRWECCQNRLANDLMPVLTLSIANWSQWMWGTKWSEDLRRGFTNQVIHQRILILCHFTSNAPPISFAFRKKKRNKSVFSLRAVLYFVPFWIPNQIHFFIFFIFSLFFSTSLEKEKWRRRE